LLFILFLFFQIQSKTILIVLPSQLPQKGRAEVPVLIIAPVLPFQN